MITITEYVSEKDFPIFHNAIRTTNARYVSDPVLCADRWRVAYTFNNVEDHNEFVQIVARATTPIREVNSTSLSHRMRRKLRRIVHRVLDPFSE